MEITAGELCYLLAKITAPGMDNKVISSIGSLINFNKMISST